MDPTTTENMFQFAFIDLALQFVDTMFNVLFSLVVPGVLSFMVDTFLGFFGIGATV